MWLAPGSLISVLQSHFMILITIIKKVIELYKSILSKILNWLFRQPDPQRSKITFLRSSGFDFPHLPTRMYNESRLMWSLFGWQL